MPEIIERTAKLFECGEYPDKGLTVTESDIDTLISGFTSADVKIEHSETPFDGALGSVTSIWRDGPELKAKIGFPSDAWSLIDRAGAKKLSVGIARDFSALKEVSLVKNPRVAGAAVFDDRIEVFGEMIEVATFASWQGLTADEIQSQIKALCNNSTKYCYIAELAQDYAVVEYYSDGDTKNTYMKYGYLVKDKQVVLGTSEAVERQTKWVTANMNADPINGKPSGGINMPETTNGAIPAEGTATFTDEQKAEIAKMLSEVRTGVETQFSTSIDQLRAENAALAHANKIKDVQFTLDSLKREGKLTPACEPMAKEILMSGSQVVTFGDAQTDIAGLFTKFVEALPKQIDFSEQGKTDGAAQTNYTAEEIMFAEKLGVKLGGV